MDDFVFWLANTSVTVIAIYREHAREVLWSLMLEKDLDLLEVSTRKARAAKNRRVEIRMCDRELFYRQFGELVPSGD